MADYTSTLSLLLKSDNMLTGVNQVSGALGKLTNVASMAQMAFGAVFATGAIRSASSFVKAYSDLEETSQKFGVVFKSVSKKAADAVNTLNKSYNMAVGTSKKLLSDTGDLLTGFGFSGDAAIDLSLKVQTLAADLASFTNYEGGTAGASQALTKALLGEREQIKQLGIAIQETDVQRQMEMDKKNGEIYQNKRVAKAMATYKIAMSQTKNALGDTARSSDTFAYKMRALTEAVGDFKENVGEAIIGPAKTIVAGFNKVITTFNDLPPSLRKSIALGGTLIAVIRSAAIAFGPTLLAITNTIAARRISSAATNSDTLATESNTVAGSGNAASMAGQTAALNTLSIARERDTATLLTNTAALTAPEKINRT